MKPLLVVILAAAAGAAAAAAVNRPWLRWDSSKDVGLLFPGVPPPVPHAGRSAEKAEKPEEDNAVTRISRLHDDEKGVTCWFVWQPLGNGVGLSCLPDSYLNHRLAER